MIGDSFFAFGELDTLACFGLNLFLAETLSSQSPSSSFNINFSALCIKLDYRFCFDKRQPTRPRSAGLGKQFQQQWSLQRLLSRLGKKGFDNIIDLVLRSVTDAISLAAIKQVEVGVGIALVAQLQQAFV